MFSHLALTCDAPSNDVHLLLSICSFFHAASLTVVEMKFAGVTVARKAVRFFDGGSSGKKQLEDFELVAMRSEDDRGNIGGVIGRFLRDYLPPKRSENRRKKER